MPQIKSSPDGSLYFLLLQQQDSSMTTVGKTKEMGSHLEPLKSMKPFPLAFTGNVLSALLKITNILLDFFIYFRI